MKKFDISNLIVSKIHDVYSYTLTEDTEGSAVSRNSLLILKLKGVSVYTVGGKRYTADENTILYIPAGVEYSVYVDRAGECIVAELDVAPTKGETEICEFITGGDAEVISTAKSVLHYWKLKGPAYHSKCLSEIYDVITRISNENAFSLTLAGKYGLIHRSVKYIEKNYTDKDLYTTELAEMSGIGETYYRNIFIAVFNTPPTKYIRQYRVDKAKELLVNTTASVEEIAEKVGFANSSYFCKVFKSLTGVTPSDFAQRAKKLG